MADRWKTEARKLERAITMATTFSEVTDIVAAALEATDLEARKDCARIAEANVAHHDGWLELFTEGTS